MKPESGSLPLLRALHDLVFAAEEVRAVLDAAFEELSVELRDRPEAPHATRAIPTHLFARALPQGLPGIDGHETGSRTDQVRLCRAFLLLRGACMAAPERHANSVQRLVSYRGRGRIHQGVVGGGLRDLRPRAICSPHGSGAGSPARSSAGSLAMLPPASPGFPAASRFWDIVPPGVWHFPEADGEEDWATVTFHSAAEDEIIDELWEA